MRISVQNLANEILFLSEEKLKVEFRIDEKFYEKVNVFDHLTCRYLKEQIMFNRCLS